MDGHPTWTDCDEAGDYVVPNVLSPRDLVFRPDNMDKTVPHYLKVYSVLCKYTPPPPETLHRCASDRVGVHVYNIQLFQRNYSLYEKAQAERQSSPTYNLLTVYEQLLINVQ